MADSASNAICRINRRRPHVLGPPDSGRHDPKGVAVVGDNVWVTNNLVGTVDRIAMTGIAVAGTVVVGGTHSDHFIDGRLWVSQPAQHRRDRPSIGRLVRTLGVGASPGPRRDGRHALGDDHVKPRLHRGGKFRIAGDDLLSIDPPYPSTLGLYELLDAPTTAWSISARVRRGCQRDRAGPRHRDPNPTNDGRTYAFQLRDGICWSTGNR